MAANKKPIYPRYDLDRDGNPFYWIQAACAHIRKNNINGQGRRTVPPLTFDKGKPMK